MNFDLVINNIKFLGQRVFLGIKEGKIAEFSFKDLSIEGVPVFDGQGCTLFPSFIDAHVHLREPGFEYKEDIESGLKAALAGGFGQVLAMANTNPVNDKASVTEFMLTRARELYPSGPSLHPVGALTRGLQGEEMAPLGELAQAGCKAFSNDGLPVKNNELFRRCVEYAHDLGLLVIDHCEDPDLSEAGVINEGKMSSYLGLKGIPTVAESLQVARDILLAAYLDIPLHLAHISCKESVELIAWAKEKGIPVSAETCPHYLLLTEEILADYNTLARVNPPLRTEEDRQALLAALRTGVIDILVTDHAPHADFEKEVPLAQAPNGISGLDTALALSLELKRQGQLQEQDLIRLWAETPATLFNLNFNSFKPGDRADFILVDESKKWVVREKTMYSKGKNTPFWGQTLRGKVKYHFLEGKLVYEDK